MKSSTGESEKEWARREEERDESELRSHQPNKYYRIRIEKSGYRLIHNPIHRAESHAGKPPEVFVVGFNRASCRPLRSRILSTKEAATAMALAVEREFIGAGCNRIVNNVSWGRSGLVAFGAQNAVAIFCPQVSELLHVFSPVLV